MDGFGISPLFERDLYKENELNYALKMHIRFFSERMSTLYDNLLELCMECHKHRSDQQKLRRTEVGLWKTFHCPLRWLTVV